MMKQIQQIFVLASLATATVASAAGTNDIAISLHQRTDRGEVVLDILVSNVSTAAVEIISEGIAPPWSVSAWFQWEVDGKPAKYLENVARIPSVKESWRIPKGGVVLWATIPPRDLKRLVKNDQGQKEWHSAIADKKRHSVTIMPGRQWKEHRRSLLQSISNVPQEDRKKLGVSSGNIEVGQGDTESSVGGDEKPAPQP